MKILLRLSTILMVLLIVVGCCNQRKSSQGGGEGTIVELVDSIMDEYWRDFFRYATHYGKIIRGASTKITDRPITTPTGKIMGHGYVDLGLSVKWATCNVGASAPWIWGDFFEWGDTADYSFNTDTCEAYKKRTGDFSGDPRYDVARAKWGGTWRMPTKEECKELIDKCNWAFTPLNCYGDYSLGCMVTGPNGNRIFLPAAGNFYGCHDNMDERGYYWTSTPVENNTHDTRVGQWKFCFGNDYCGGLDLYLSCDYPGFDGFSIRPVSE